MAKKKKKPGGAGAAVGGYITPASGYKGIKRAGMDAGLNREASTAVSIAANTVGSGVGLPIAGGVYHAAKAHKEGVLKASRATNSPATQKRKAKATSGVAGLNNRMLGGGGSHHLTSVSGVNPNKPTRKGRR